MANIRTNIKFSGREDRLDMALVKAQLGLSRRKIRRIIDLGGAYINGKRVRIASRTVSRGDLIELSYLPDALSSREPMTDFTFTDADILHFDHGLIAVNKPPGLPAQATRDQSIIHVEAVLKRFFKSKGERLRNLCLLHRLDKETSGVILLGYEEQVSQEVMQAFKDHQIQKTYHALCWGKPAESEFSVKNHLSPIDKKLGMVKIVRSGGKFSETNFSVVAENTQLGLAKIACYPKTGRSHQLRVHLDSLGLPIVGDKKYGSKPRDVQGREKILQLASHHMLHALKIELTLATKHQIAIEAPPPATFSALERLGGF